MTFDVILDDQVIYVRAPGNYWADEQPVPLPAASDRGAWEPLADPRFADASPQSAICGPPCGERPCRTTAVGRRRCVPQPIGNPIG